MISTAFQAVFVMLSAFGSTYFKNLRTYFLAGNLAVSLAGVLMIRRLDASHIWPKFIGFCLSLAYTANIPLILSMSSSNIGGFTKKNTVNAMVSCINPYGKRFKLTLFKIFISYCTGNIIGPQLFFDREASRGYPSAFLAMIVCFSVGILLCFLLRVYLYLENKRRDRVAGDASLDEPVGNLNMADQTDGEMTAFRYVY
jgi:hypothetical protein